MVELEELEERDFLSDRFRDELPQELRDMADSFLDKGMFVFEERTCPSRGATILHGKGTVRFKRRNDEWIINYGTGRCHDELCWSEYEDIGKQILFFLKGKKGFSAEGEAGRPIVVEQKE